MTESPDVPPTDRPRLRGPWGLLLLAAVSGIAARAFGSRARLAAETERVRTEGIASEVALLVDGDALAGTLARRGDASSPHASSTQAPSTQAGPDPAGAVASTLREAARGEGLEPPIRALVLKEEERSRIEAARGTGHAGALEVVLSTSDEEPSPEDDYEPAMAPAFFDRSPASIGARGLLTLDVRAFVPVRDSFGATVAVLEARRNSWAGALPHVLARGAGLLCAAFALLAALRLLGAEDGPLRRLLEERRHAAALERRERPRPRNLATKLEDASHTYARLLEGEDGIDPFGVEGPLQAAARSVHRVVELARIGVTTQIAEELRGSSLAEPVLVFAVLQALLANAVEKTQRRGSVTVRARIEPRSGALRYDISDNGVGISFREQGQLLRPLTQSDAPSPDAISGLDVARSAAASLGGSIGFESQPGQGTRFWFVLPAEQAFAQRAAA